MRRELIESQGEFSLSEEDFDLIKAKFDFILPENIVEFMIQYGDSFLKECYYENNSIYVVPNYICGKSKNNPNLFEIIEGNIFYGKTNHFPFATDYGGWVLNIALDKLSHGEIWIDRFDSGEANSFVFVASSLEEFVDGLIIEE